MILPAIYLLIGIRLLEHATKTFYTRKLKHHRRIFGKCHYSCVRMSNTVVDRQLNVKYQKTNQYESLLQNIKAENQKNIAEANKWRERTTELLQNEEKMKADLERVKAETKMREPQNQHTQTEVIEKTNKETNTDSLFNETRSVMVVKGTCEDIASGIGKQKDSSPKLSGQDTISHPKSPTTCNLTTQPKLNSTSSISSEDHHLQPIDSTKESALKDNNNDTTDLMAVDSLNITTSCNNVETTMTKSNQEPAIGSIQCLSAKTDVQSNTHAPTKTDLQQPKSIVECMEYTHTNIHQFNDNTTQPISGEPAPFRDMAQNASLPGGIKVVISSQPLHEASPNVPPTNKDAALAQNAGLAQHVKHIALPSRSAPNDSSIKEKTATSSAQTSGLLRQSLAKSYKAPASERKNSALLQRGMAGIISSSKPLEKRTPLLAVVKPSSATTLQESTEPGASVTSHHLTRRETTTTKSHEPTVEGHNGTSHSRVVDRESRNDQTETISVGNLAMLSLTQNLNTTSTNIANTQTKNTLGEGRGSRNEGKGPSAVDQEPSNEKTISSLTNLATVNLTQNLNTTAISTVNNQTQKILSEISKERTEKHESENTMTIPQQTFTMGASGQQYSEGQKTTYDKEMIKTFSEPRVLRSQTAKIPKSNQEFPSKPLQQNTSLSTKSKVEQTTSIGNESIHTRNSTVEDFCFSDEEDESIPRAIGSQVDRIETFLKNERLRLSKKRKATDE